MCSFRLRRDSTEYLVMFFTDIILFYLIPLLLSVVLYTLIGKMLLSKSRNKLPGGGTRNSLSATAANKTNQSRVQVSEIYYKVAHTILIQTKYRISAINTRGYYSLLAFLVRVLYKGGSYLRVSK